MLTARGKSPAAFERRCIPPGCVAPSSNIPDILGRHALPGGRLAVLGTTPDFHHGLIRLLLLLFSSVFVTAACNRTPPPPSLQPEATVKDIMDSMVDPSADVLWESVATIVSAKGTEERQPRTDDDWKNVHRHAVILVEATNLLKMDGRHVAKAKEKSENPGIELEPEQMEQLIKDDRQAFIKFAQGLHDAALPALRATEERDPKGLLDAGEAIDTACENCHLKYWYPLDKQAEKAREGAASPRKP
jgi:hypothetical protein